MSHSFLHHGYPWFRINYKFDPFCHRADPRFAPSQWETSLQSNAVSHWLGANPESALNYIHIKQTSLQTSCGDTCLIHLIFIKRINPYTCRDGCLYWGCFRGTRNASKVSRPKSPADFPGHAVHVTWPSIPCLPRTTAANLPDSQTIPAQWQQAAFITIKGSRHVAFIPTNLFLTPPKR